jgi:hypothetical protein
MSSKRKKMATLNSSPYLSEQSGRALRKNQNLASKMAPDIPAQPKTRKHLSAEEIFQKIEPDARPEVLRDLKAFIEARVNVCLIGAPGALRTGLIKAVSDELGIMLIVVDGAKAINGQEFVVELLCSLKKPLKTLLKKYFRQIELAINNSSVPHTQIKIIRQIIVEIEGFLEDFKKSVTPDNCLDYFLKAVNLFLESTAKVDGRSVIVLERVRELRKWQKLFNKKDMPVNSKIDNNVSQKVSYEILLRESVSKAFHMSYVILDISSDVANSLSSESDVDHCKTIGLHPIPKKYVRIWIREFLEKQHNFEINDSFECLDAINSSFEGHTGLIHSLLIFLLRKKNSNQLHGCKELSESPHAPANQAEKTVIDVQDINEAIKELKSCAAPALEATLNTLTTANMRKLVEALAIEKTSSVYSQKFLTRFQWPSRSTVAASLKALQNQGLVSKNGKGEFFITVPLLADWIRYPVDPMGSRDRHIDAAAYSNDLELREMLAKVSSLTSSNQDKPKTFDMEKSH